ncbi:unnamed protein product, partial [Chrysoparadoxa australica]
MNVFDWRMIVCQIIAMQCFYYVSMCFILGLLRGVLGLTIPVSLSVFFAAEGKLFSISNAEGWACIAVHILAALLGAGLQVLVIEKAKRCLDFSSTLQMLHMIICWKYAGRFPHGWHWWGVQIVSFFLMVLIGEYLCAKKEMRDIPI